MVTFVEKARFNYAALVALLALISFGAPFAVQLAEGLGVSRSFAVVLSLALLLVAGFWAYLRWQQGLGIPNRLDNLPDEPYTEAFFRDGVFQGDLLTNRGEPEAGLAVYRAYRALLIRHGQTTDELDKSILDLEQRLRESVLRGGAEGDDVSAGI